MTLACENGEPLAALNPCPKHPHPSIRAGGLLLRQKHLHPALAFGFYLYNRKVLCRILVQNILAHQSRNNHFHSALDCPSVFVRNFAKKALQAGLGHLSVKVFFKRCNNLKFKYLLLQRPRSVVTQIFDVTIHYVAVPRKQLT